MNGSKKAILLRREKWRIGYNLILLVEGLWLLREHLVAAFTRYWHIMVVFAVAANVCYCLGPLLEICVRTLWGLRADRTRYQSFLAGFCYFLFSVGLLFSMWWVWMWTLRGVPKFEDARLRVAIMRIRELSKGVDVFYSDVGRYPTTTEGLQVLVERPKDVSQKVWHGPYLKLRLDPWNHEYHYTYIPQDPSGLNYRIVSAAKDGKLGTEDDIKNHP